MCYLCVFIVVLFLSCLFYIWISLSLSNRYSWLWFSKFIHNWYDKIILSTCWQLANRRKWICSLYNFITWVVIYKTYLIFEDQIPLSGISVLSWFRLSYLDPWRFNLSIYVHNEQIGKPNKYKSLWEQVNLNGISLGASSSKRYIFGSKLI